MTLLQITINPPYRPLNATSSFTSYAKTEFGDGRTIPQSWCRDCRSSGGHDDDDDE